MNESLQDGELLTQYLDGELTGSEKADLEGRLQREVPLQEQLLQLKAAIAGVKQFGLTQKISSLHEEMMAEFKKNPVKAKVVSMNKTIRYAMAVAASVLILFAGARWFMAAQVSPDKIYNETFVDFNVSETRGNTTSASTIEKYYQQKEYARVVAAPRTVGIDSKDSLLIGLSYLHMANYTKAISFFESLSTGTNDFQQDAAFYLALSYVKNHNYTKALPLLEKIVANPLHLYHDQVNETTITKLKKLAGR